MKSLWGMNKRELALDPRIPTDRKLVLISRPYGSMVQFKIVWSPRCEGLNWQAGAIHIKSVRSPEWISSIRTLYVWGRWDEADLTILECSVPDWNLVLDGVTLFNESVLL